MAGLGWLDQIYEKTYIVYRDRHENKIGIFPIYGPGLDGDLSAYVSKFNKDTSKKFKYNIIALTDDEGLIKILDSYPKNTKIRKHKIRNYFQFKDIKKV